VIIYRQPVTPRSQLGLPDSLAWLRNGHGGWHN
jgi:hypothetical protein